MNDLLENVSSMLITVFECLVLIALMTPMIYGFINSEDLYGLDSLKEKSLVSSSNEVVEEEPLTKYDFALSFLVKNFYPEKIDSMITDGEGNKRVEVKDISPDYMTVNKILITETVLNSTEFKSIDEETKYTLKDLSDGKGKYKGVLYD